MSTPLPSSAVPTELLPRVLPILISQLSKSTSGDNGNDARSTIHILQKTLQVISRLVLQGASSAAFLPPLKPLQVLLAISKQSPTSLTPDILLAGIISYPGHLRATNVIISSALASRPTTGSQNETESKGTLESFRGDIVPSLVTQLQLSKSPKELFKALKVLRSIVRSHEELLGLILEEASYVLPALRTAYDTLNAQAVTANGSGVPNGAANGGENVEETVMFGKAEALMLLHALVNSVQGESREALKRLISSPSGGAESSKSGSAGLMRKNDLRKDYEALFDRNEKLNEAMVTSFQSARDGQASIDPRVKLVHNLFPHIPAHTLLDALDHPYFTPHPMTLDPETAAAPIIDALLSDSNSIPQELYELKASLQADVAAGSSQPVTGAIDIAQALLADTVASGIGGDVSSKGKPYERRNIWDEDKMDMSRLKISDEYSDLPQMGNTIPDHLRESIMRLVQSQAQEEAEQAAAIREAHGLRVSVDNYDDAVEGSDGEGGEGEGGSRKMKMMADGEESGEEEEGDKVVSRKATTEKHYDVDQQSKLELAYLSDPKVFNRDSATRRSAARTKLKQLTGMDDAQLEGWKIMLERNPHKEAILSRHVYTPARDSALSLSSTNPNTNRGEGSGSGRGGRGKNRGGRGGGGGASRGGSEGGGVARGGGGGGGGRGGGGRGQNKGSRGHSNAARTRGHDKKMARMGAGI